jgi:hypothetical protein
MSIKRALTAGLMTAVVATGGVAFSAPATAAGDRPVGVAHVAAWKDVYLHNNGTITVSAGVKCSPGWFTTELDMQVNQGDSVGSGFTIPSVPCDNAWHPVRFVISDIGGAFVPGPSTISSQIIVNNVDSGDSAGGHDVGRVGCVRRPHTSHATCPTT